MMTNAAVASPPRREHVVLYGVAWSTYQTLLNEIERSGRGLRLTFDEGTLEIMSPLRQHERVKKLVGRLIESMAREMKIPIEPAGSTTLFREDLLKGAEPDEGYYVQHEAVMRARRDYDAEVDPPPDLVIEVDETSSSVPRMPIYGGMGVPEVWRWDGRAFEFFERTDDGTYRPIERSRAFPIISPQQVNRAVRMLDERDHNSIVDAFLEDVRKSSA